MTPTKPEIVAFQQTEFASTPPQGREIIEHPKGWANWRVLLNGIIIGLSVGLFGYDNSFAAPLVALPLFITKYQGAGIAFTARNLDLVITVPLVGAALGTFVATPLMRYLGRKKAFLVAYFLLCVPGSFLQLFAPDLGALVVGRFWNYVGVSVLTTTAPLYLSELVPPHVRARSVGFCIAGSSATGIIGTTVVWATARLTDSRQYKVPLAIQVALPAAFGLLTLLADESPSWYIQHDQLEAARSTLMRLRNNKVDLVEAELTLIQAAMSASTARQAGVRFWDILKPEHLKRTLTAGALLPLSQVGGQILVLTYSTVLLVQSGVANPFEITIIISCLTFLGTIVGPVLVDSAGRRPVALIGFSILFILDMTAGGLGAAGLTTKSQRLGLAAVFIIFAFFNAVSFQSLSYLLPTEVSTAALREPTVSWAVFWSYATAIITTFAVPQITAPDAGNLGVKTAFIFGGCVFLTAIWSYFYLPETKARTVAEIDEMYRISLPMRKWRKHQCQVLNEAALGLPQDETGRDTRV
ncbi:hypothetical protein PV08_02732 [Exophiala spinifera]|uniref:Major facilitator superfamily (MFS) profile domain-containing protein n=1 Tax=Exophiala spinifera TaxID=91928 RepID=A0A0D2C4C6_9EURO|nr:uncharacterized protein PV08_02732 [Exophiala spinifera]KIW18444.1 hypothetical protein PV08_02732 [Exophiala spinifera]